MSRETTIRVLGTFCVNEVQWATRETTIRVVWTFCVNEVQLTPQYACVQEVLVVELAEDQISDG